MNILVGESTKTSGNYSLFAETQMLSLTWSADPIGARVSSIRDGDELVVMRSGQQMKTVTSSTADPQGGESVETRSIPDPEMSVAKVVEAVETFKEAVGLIPKTKLVDKSDLNSLNIAEVLNAVPAPQAEAEASEEAQASE